MVEGSAGKIYIYYYPIEDTLSVVSDSGRGYYSKRFTHDDNLPLLKTKDGRNALELLHPEISPIMEILSYFYKVRKTYPTSGNPAEQAIILRAKTVNGNVCLKLTGLPEKWQNLGRQRFESFVRNQEYIKSV